MPRTVYRRYVLQRFNEAYSRLRRAGCSVAISTTEIQSIRRMRNRAIEVSSTKGRDEFDLVVLGIGASANDPLPLLAQDPRYIANIYQSPQWEERLQLNGHVLVLGSKLSAIDATVSLLTKRDDVQVTMVSRGGVLPSVRRELLLQELPNMNAKNPTLPRDYPRLRSIFVQAARDLRQLSGGRSRAPDELLPDKQLDRDIEACEAGTNKWQHAIGHFIEEMNNFWPLLTAADQKEFKRRYSPFISRFVSSFPLQNATVLQNGFAKGQLSVAKVGSKLANLVEAGTLLLGRAELTGRQFDLVVNCTGLNPLAFWETPLGISLREQGVEVNPHGGLTVEPKTMRIASAQPELDCYAVGAPVSGSLLVTNYVRASVIQADLVLSDIENRFETRQFGRKAA